MVTFATDVPLEPIAAADVGADALLELSFDDLSLEHPDRPTTTIAVAAAATDTERFTRFSFVVKRSVDVDGPLRQYALC
jgi:hypothetical protein